MQTHLLMLIVSLFLVFAFQVAVLIYGANSKEKGSKVTGQLLPLIITGIFTSAVFFVSGGFSMKPVEWVEFTGIFVAPVLLMTLFNMGALGTLGMIQSKRQHSKVLFIVSLLNVLAWPAVGYTAWHFFG